jgi:hypothetical protein
MSTIEDVKKQIDALQKRQTKNMETLMKAFNDLVDEAKKKNEVKPVFPNRDNWDGIIYGIESGVIDEIVWTDDVSKLLKYGLTFRTKEDAGKELKRQEARKYVIEAINKANKGDNGFNYGRGGYLLEYGHRSEKFIMFHYGNTQSGDDCEYIRTKEASENLLKDDIFIDAYKTMKGIKS